MAGLEQTRQLVTEIPGPESLELTKRRAAAVPRGVSVTMPVFAARAGGGIVEDVDGNRLIDFGSGIAVTTIGNSSPRVVDAVRAQVAEFTHTCFMVTPYEQYVAVAEQLNRITPGSGEKRSVLFNSGAEAVENSIKIARSYTRKPAVIAFDTAAARRLVNSSDAGPGISVTSWRVCSSAATTSSSPRRVGASPLKPIRIGVSGPLKHRRGRLRPGTCQTRGTLIGCGVRDLLVAPGADTRIPRRKTG
ncbi:MAG TPA: aminotransferase class III-fold pyridoxal phosphate-dependent enzyme, partial [Mycobacterium sp.]